MNYIYLLGWTVLIVLMFFKVRLVMKIRLILLVSLAIIVIQIAKELMFMMGLIGLAVLVMTVDSLIAEKDGGPTTQEQTTKEPTTRELALIYRHPTEEAGRYKVLQKTQTTHTDAEKVEYNALIDDFIELNMPSPISKQVSFQVERYNALHNKNVKRVKLLQNTGKPTLTRYMVLHKNKANHTQEEKYEYEALFKYWRNKRFFAGVA